MAPNARLVESNVSLHTNRMMIHVAQHAVSKQLENNCTSILRASLPSHWFIEALLGSLNYLDSFLLQGTIYRR